MILLINPSLLSLLVDFALGRFGDFTVDQGWFYCLSLIGSTAWWVFLAWLIRRPGMRRHEILAWFIAVLYAADFVLVYGYRLTVGVMPNYYTFEYIFLEPYNSWTLLRDSWNWGSTLAIPVAVLLFHLGLSHVRAALAARKRLGPVFASLSFALALTIQLVFQNNIRFVDQCYTADLTVTSSVMRNLTTSLSDNSAGQHGLSARVPAQIPDLSAHLARTADGHPWNILILLTESLRADEFGLYGYGRNTSPFLDSLVKADSEKVVVGDNAITASSMTFVSVPCLVTGVASLAPARLLHTQPSFWEYFKAGGYETFFMTSQSHEWENIGTYFNIPAIDHKFTKETAGVGADNDLGIDDHFVVDNFLSWLSERDHKSSFAGIVQFNQTHFPYHTDSSFRPFGDSDRRDSYDNSLRYLDMQIGRVVEALRDAGELDRTLILLTSDHGEGFKEHGVFGHLNCQYREGIRVPMIWRIPDGVTDSGAYAQLRTNARQVTSNLDILPTILDACGIWSDTVLAPYRAEFHGVSLLRPIPANRVVYCSNLTETSRRHRGLSILIRDWHYILNLSGEKTGQQELYHWGDDPGETKNLILVCDPSIRSQLRDALLRFPLGQRIARDIDLGMMASTR